MTQEEIETPTPRPETDGGIEPAPGEEAPSPFDEAERELEEEQ